eukprot:612396-Prorocentrum_minimum.AAC.1
MHTDLTRRIEGVLCVENIQYVGKQGVKLFGGGTFAKSYCTMAAQSPLDAYKVRRINPSGPLPPLDRSPANRNDPNSTPTRYVLTTDQSDAGSA